MNDFRLEPGTVLAEKYRLESVIGTGGMGTVYQAEHLALRAPVAVKVIDREVDEGDVALARFMREAQSAASLRSPHVVQILDYGMEGKRPFMVMEMLEGEPLADRLKRVGRLSPQETYRVISHVARAVSKAHEAEIIHRDLKPDNVFLVHNEGDEIAKVLDFGVAKVESTQLDGEGHTRTGSLLGTPYYMSPEQAQGNKDIDARSDLWALGVIAFECLTGRRPFSSDGLGDLVLQICIRDIPVPSKVAPVPTGFDDWFKRACSREPEARFQTARELAESLRDALDLGSEAGGSVPESKWVSAAGSVSNATMVSETGALGSETTQPDSIRGPHSEDGRPTEVDGPRTHDDDGDDGLPPDSKWEIVPHGEEEPKSSKGDVLEDTKTDRVLAGLPEHDERRGGGGSIAFVAIIALLVGGAAVFGIRQTQTKGADDETQIVRPRPMGTAKATAKDSTSEPNPAATKATTKPKQPTSTARTLDDETPPPTDSDEPSEVTDATEEPADSSETLGEGPEDALDAIESAAKEALEKREREAAEKAAAKDPNSVPKEPSDKPTDGPQPRLPDGLAPAPAPPPPPQ